MGVKQIIIKDNLQILEENIQKALQRAGRKDDVTLIAVTKTQDIEDVRQVVDLGVKNIGENKVQDLKQRVEALGDIVNFHMIGHLQTNKVKDIIKDVILVHSLDRLSLAIELNRRAKSNNRIVDVLIQVNVAEEESKFGLSLGDVIPFIEQILGFEHIRVRGLMAMAPFTQDSILLRSVFKSMYKLKEDISNKNYEGISMDYLSMGMTNDYEIAIEEGSNMVRVGTGIFGLRN